MNILSILTRINGSPTPAKRVGRGIGSGKGGHNSTYGTKGQKARVGKRIPTWFEGGQTPITKRMPYIRGFVNHNKPEIYSLNLQDIAEVFVNESLINPALLFKEKMISIDPSLSNAQFKLLGRGTIEKGLKFEGFTYSKSAKEKIEKAGGSITSV